MFLSRSGSLHVCGTLLCYSPSRFCFVLLIFFLMGFQTLDKNHIEMHKAAAVKLMVIAKIITAPK